MVLEICLIEHIVDEPCLVGHAGCIGCRIRPVKRQLELEVREILFKLVIIFQIERLFQAARTIEEADFPGGLLSLEQMHDVASHRCHTCTSADKDKFLVCRKIVRQEEFSVRSGDSHLVSRFEREDV